MTPSNAGSAPDTEIHTAAQAVCLHANDNVAVAANPLVAGQVVQFAKRSETPNSDSSDPAAVTISEPINMGHKFAIQPIAKGDRILKYGQIIGFASKSIDVGQWVHTQNVDHSQFDRDHAIATQIPDAPLPVTDKTFMGFRRPGGKVGTRNYIGIISTVNCSASVSKTIARHFTPEHLQDYENVDGIVALTHSTGCGMAGTGSRHFDQLQRVMAGFAKHPNIGAYLIIGLGCEVATTQGLIEDGNLVQLNVTEANSSSTTNKPLETTASENPNKPISFSIQETGGTRKTVTRGIEAVKELLPLANKATRQPVPASEITLGLECGGSDAYSGITANPALGVTSDMLVAAGGTAILSETSEIYGAEHLLTRRARNKKVGGKLLELIEWWQWYTSTWGVEINNNPSPGNKAGGLTTIYEKSLGAVAKGGSTALNAVYDYACPVTDKGFVFMDTPGFDPPSVTGMVAGGANMICFTTGRGSCFGCKPVPSIKIVTNTETYDRLRDDMDFNAGIVLEGASVEEVGKQIFELVLSVASGQKTLSEQHGIGDEEFLPWHIGPVL